MFRTRYIQDWNFGWGASSVHHFNFITTVVAPATRMPFERLVWQFAQFVALAWIELVQKITTNANWSSAEKVSEQTSKLYALCISVHHSIILSSSRLILPFILVRSQHTRTTFHRWTSTLARAAPQAGLPDSGIHCALTKLLWLNDMRMFTLTINQTEREDIVCAASGDCKQQITLLP